MILDNFLQDAAAAANAPSSGSRRHGDVLMASCSDQELHALHELMGKLGLLAGSSGKVDDKALGAGTGPSSLGNSSASITSEGIHAPLPPLEGSGEVAGGKGGGKVARARLEGFMTRAAAAAAYLGEHPTPSSAWASLLRGAGSASGIDQGDEAAAREAASLEAASGKEDLDAQVPNYLDKNTTGTGDFIHPLSRLLLARRPPAYVLDPRAHKLSASGDDAPEDGGGGSGGSGAPGGASGAGGGKGGSTVKKGAAKNSGRPPAASASAAATPIAASTPPPQPLPSDSAPKGASSDQAQLGLDVIQPAPLNPTTSDTGAAAGMDGGSGDGTDQPGSARSGRSRSSINYSLLSGKKEKQNQAAVAAPAAAETAMAGATSASTAPDAMVASSAVLPPLKKKRGRPSAAAAAAAAVAQALATGLPAPLSATPSGTPSGPASGVGGEQRSLSGAVGVPLAPAAVPTSATASLLSRAVAAPPSSLSEDDLAVFNPVVADVARCINAGPVEGTLDQQVRPGLVHMFQFHRSGLYQLSDGYALKILLSPYVAVFTPFCFRSGLCLRKLQTCWLLLPTTKSWLRSWRCRASSRSR